MIRGVFKRTAAAVLMMLLIAGTALVAGCSRSEQKPAISGTSQTASQGSNRVFQVKGVIKELKPDGKTVVIRHEEVPDYMPAMTMPFEAKIPDELKGLEVGDSVEFRMTVTDNDVWLDQI